MSDILVPTLGESVSEATVARWLKAPGDVVAADEALVELETDKVTLEVNAPQAGTLGEIVAAEGATVGPGAILGKISAGPSSAKGVSAKAAPAKPAPEKSAPEPAKAAPSAAPAAPASPPESAPVSGGTPEDLVVPTLGESVSEATVASWLKQPGEAAKADEPLLELETDKVTLEVNAPGDGVLGEIVAKQGATVAPGAKLGVFLLGASGGSTQATAPAAKETAPAAPASAPTPAPTPAPSGAKLDPAAAKRSNGKITKDALLAFLNAAGAQLLEASGPAVRKLVEENGLDPSAIPATGKDGRLTKGDVLAFLENPPAPTSAPAGVPASAAAPAAPPATGKREERKKLSKLRQTIARRLKEAQNTAAMLTTFNEVDMSQVMALRAEYKETFEKKHGVKLGFSSFFAKAVVAALKEVPAVGASIDGDEVVTKNYFDIGMAVSTPNGLMVPVIRDCDQKSFAEIESSLSALAAKGREGKLGMDDMSGGVFTITNGGVFGSLLSTPILNMPQSGILGLHKIEERPIALKGEVVIRPMMYTALSYDHRIIDGREAVTFLVKIKEAIEDPRRLLLGM